ncbi:YopX family protein [Brevibacillus sp. DP1.3A]|nr:YopX family protein [Brevibacillus sp. DP1.3A]UED77968.1 YopX family protein [Brevibacillus sp. DP1.3A]
MDEVELLQYTGLRDKNGKEIYEGDVIHVPDHDWNGYVMFTGDCQYALKGKTVLGNDGYLLFTQIYLNKCEVIGNIYENPELL